MTEPKTARVYLVIRAADRSMRLLKVPRTMSPQWWRPTLRTDEVAIPIDVRFPAGWGRVLAGAITVDVPDDMPTATASGEAVTGGTPGAIDHEELARP